MLLSDKDFPLFVGGFKLGFASGLAMKVQLSSVVDFSLRAVYVQQAGSDGALRAVQVPTAIGPILAHAGAGVASLLTGGAYPTIRDSFYVDLNVKYAK